MKKIRKRASALVLAPVLVLGLFACPAPAKEIQAGTARVELRPPAGIPMAGYGARRGTAQGVLDPLQAKILVLEGKDQSVALITLDLAGVFPEEQLEQVRARVKASCGISDVIFNASHTHSGPVLKQENPDAWQKQAVEDIGAAIERAWKSRRPARVGLGRGAVFIGHNRVYYMSEGRNKMLWRNETRIRTSPVDPTVMVLRVDGAGPGGAPLAVVVNYACHPVVLGPENLDYSADYPGAMSRLVESSVPGNPLCLFVQGGAGDINPYYDKTPLAEDAVALMRETGRALGQEVLRVLTGLESRPLPDAEIRVAREILEFQPRWSKEKILARLPGTLAEDMKARLERMFRAPLKGPVTLLLVGREFALVGVPAEIFVDYQMDLRERLPGFPILFAGYTNGNLGYVPTIRAAVEGGYGASQIGAFLEVGAGNRMIDKAVIQLLYWTGKLKSTPQGP